jgi:hypothetical protein
MESLPTVFMINKPDEGSDTFGYSGTSSSGSVSEPEAEVSK